MHIEQNLNNSGQLDWMFWLRLFALAILARVITTFILLGDMPLINDAVDYSDFASFLSLHFPGDKSYYWPPGTSMFVSVFYSLFGSDLMITRLVIFLVSMVSLVLVALISMEVLESEQAARFSAYAYAVYPPVLMLSGQLYSHHVAALCVLLLAYTGIKAIRRGKMIYYFASGLFLGYGILTRPSMMSLSPVLFFVLIVYPYFYKDKTGAFDIKNIAAGAAVFFVGLALIVFPVLKYNQDKGVGMTVSTNNERNFFLGNNPYTPNYKTWHFASRPDLEDLDPEVREYFLGLYQSENKRAALRSEAINYILENPGVTLLRTFNRIRAFWGFDYVMAREIQNYYDLDYTGLGLLVLIEGGGYCFIMLLVLMGIFVLWKGADGKLAWWLILLVLAYEVPYMLAFSNGFYHYPVIPLLMPFAGLAIQALLRQKNKSDSAIPYNNRLFLVSAAIFIFIQFEYAYYLFKYAE